MSSGGAPCLPPVTPPPPGMRLLPHRPHATMTPHPRPAPLPPLRSPLAALAATYATPEDACDTQNTRALLEARPRVRYARPDVTDTRGACPEGRQWQEADLSLGYYAAAPDLACLTGGDPAAPDDDDDAADDREEEVWPVDAPAGYESSPPVRHASMSAVGSSAGGGAGGCGRQGGSGGSRRMSRSLEDLPTDIQEHILRCQCSCDHLGYGNFSKGTAPRLTNGCSTYLGPSPTKEQELQDPSQRPHPTPPPPPPRRKASKLRETRDWLASRVDSQSQRR
ncbi:hypothetical protein O3P69_006087 [Scylla paramamosain]|uniref:Uncharacterized protein n=1 Tax=Scylla paramamosain TaxID=85552 RepID=A0AAW0U684_SCYPA